MLLVGFPGGLVIKNQPANAGDVGSIPGLGKCPGEGNGNPFQYSCLKNSMDRGAWQTTVNGVTKSEPGGALWGHKKSDMTERLSTHISWMTL